MSDSLVIINECGDTSVIASESRKPKIGQWYWVMYLNDTPLYCVTHIGSNYAEIKSVGGNEDRIHFTEFLKRCTFEPNPEAHFEKQIAKYQRKLNELTNEIKELTSHLGLGQQASLSDSVGALATRGSGNAVNEYKQELVLAKDKTLPELFEGIKNASYNLGLWLSAAVVPLKAQAEQLKPLIKAVESRIFNVELYAGLVETVAQIADGQPAPPDEKIRLMQRRAYMDEECLAEYKVGGMEFDNIGEFDAWLALPENRDRILPFSKCVIAFRVRRYDKEREGVNIRDFVHIVASEQEDKSTFLYMRNGERMYRLSTQIDFDTKLFPDMGSSVVESDMVYAKMFCERVDSIISAGQYEQIVSKEEADRKALETCSEEDRWKYSRWTDSQSYKPFTPDCVYHDDIDAFIKNQIDAHNRLVVVLQGLLDRSPVFHPHPPFSLWKSEDFEKAFELIYDDSRALTAGDKPDFEAFRTRLNASLETGSVTVGQEDAWEILEAERESRRMDNDWRTTSKDYRPTRFRPYGNPGPGEVATVQKYSKKTGKCTYTWKRERMRRSWKDEEINCNLVIPSDAVLNVSAYKPGMFKQFFNDPRTRADYLKWAPLLLRAEEWHHKIKGE